MGFSRRKLGRFPQVDFLGFIFHPTP